MKRAAAMGILLGVAVLVPTGGSASKFVGPTKLVFHAVIERVAAPEERPTPRSRKGRLKLHWQTDGTGALVVARLDSSRKRPIVEHNDMWKLKKPRYYIPDEIWARCPESLAVAGGSVIIELTRGGVGDPNHPRLIGERVRARCRGAPQAPKNRDEP